MKCSICNGYHLLGESCSKNDSVGSIFNNLPKYESPKFNFEPTLPKYEPPPLNLPKYESPKFNFEPTLPKYEPPPLNLPKYEPPKFNFEPTLPKYEPPKFDLPKYEPPLPPPPMPVRDIGNNIIGHRDMMSNQIQPANNMINGGMPLNIQGNIVRDTMGNMVGQMGPGNTMFPPPSFGPPKPGF